MPLKNFEKKLGFRDQLCQGVVKKRHALMLSVDYLDVFPNKIVSIPEIESVVGKYLDKIVKDLKLNR